MVKVKVIQVCECCNGGGIHFNGVAPGVTCYFVFSHKCMNMNVFSSSLLFFRCFRALFRTYNRQAHCPSFSATAEKAVPPPTAPV